MTAHRRNPEKHWNVLVNHAVVCRGKNGSFNLCIEGGSEYGQFVVIGDVLSDKVIFRSGTLSAEEIILEINGKHIAGYTQTDAISLIKQSGEYMQVRAINPGQGISRDLRKYLGTRFVRDSVDHELQQTIRDNLYMRTVPCTTRKPRPGEVPGVDYEFLSVNEYLELEKSGRLLESGFYEGNYYGTPKPPKTPSTPGTGTIRRQKNQKQKEADRQKIRDANELGPLPDNWEMAYTKDNEAYFVDHNTGRTQWEDPRKQQLRRAPSSRSASRLAQNEETDELPPGWEKVDDPKYGTYYIDHVNRRTQYEKPEMQQRKRKISQSSAHSSRIDQERGGTNTRKGLNIDASTLQGDTIRVSLRKGAKGFGFTIVGGESAGEVLQVNNIVRGGTADVDGRLRTGDVIMRLNGRNVLSWTHTDIVRFLQTTRVGEIVELDLVRGYELPFNPQDPGVKKVGSYNVINGPELTNGIRGSNASLSSGTSNGPPKPPRSNSGSTVDRRAGSFRERNGMDSGGYTSGGERLESYRTITTSGASLPTTPTQFRSGNPQYTVISIVRGPSGFGFTIADSPYGQRVKEIIDRNRCRGLQQGDVIIRINNTVVHNLDHSKVVDVLKACPKNEQTDFQVQRSGVLTVVKSMPTPPRRELPPHRQQPNRPKSMPTFDQDQNPVAPQPFHTVRSSSSMGGIASTAGEATTATASTYEQREPQPPAENSYKSLKKAVQDNARETSADGTYTDQLIVLQRGPKGFGFRIIGGQEEGTQVSIDTIVPGGAAEVDGRLKQADVILAVDGQNVVDAPHHKVITMMQSAGQSGQVTLRIRRRNVPVDTPVDDNPEADQPEQDPEPAPEPEPEPPKPSGLPRMISVSSPNTPVVPRERRKSDSESLRSENLDNRPRDMHPYRQGGNQADALRSKSESNIHARKPIPPPVAPKPKLMREINLSRNENEGFGFVIMSAPDTVGSIIGRIIPNSPADRCGELAVNDKLIEVNDEDVTKLSHSEIVSMVKSSGFAVKLKMARPGVSRPNSRPTSQSEETLLSPPPPRPVEPSNYTARAKSAIEDDRRREEFRKYQEDMFQKQRDEMRRLEEARLRQIRDREMAQPARPKSAPLNAQNNQANGGLRVPTNGEPQRVTVQARESHSPLSTKGSMTREDRNAITESAKRKIGPGETARIVLQKGDRGFGFSIRGGEGMPLFVLRIAENGPAYEDGRLKVGDEILEINNKNAERMTHSEAVNTIRNCADSATLVIRRPIKPILGEEEKIPNGHRPQQGVERPKSGYY